MQKVAFSTLAGFLDLLEQLRAAYHVRPRSTDAVTVEVALSGERRAAAFLPDGRVAVESFAATGEGRQASLERLLGGLERLTD